LKKRLGYRRERQTDRQACENEGQIERQSCEQDGRTYLVRGFRKGWKDKLTDRLLKRMEDKLRDRLMKRMEEKLRDRLLERIKDKFRDRLLKRMEDELRDRLVSRNSGQIKRQKGRKDKFNNISVLFGFAHFAYFPFFFTSDFCCFASMRNKRTYTFFPFQAKRNFRFDFIFRIGTENDGASLTLHLKGQ
jgi:hypothetical protein